MTFWARPVAPGAAVAVGQDDYEAVRIEAGFPGTAPSSTSGRSRPKPGWWRRRSSFTKGCYTGQELVARIDSRGSNVPRHLRGLLLGGPATAGEPLYRAEAGAEPAKEAGRLTSVALSPERGWVALGYLGRAVTAGETVVVGGEGGLTRSAPRSGRFPCQATGGERGPGPPTA